MASAVVAPAGMPGWENAVCCGMVLNIRKDHGDPWLISLGRRLEPLAEGFDPICFRVSLA